MCSIVFRGLAYVIQNPTGQFCEHGLADAQAKAVV